MWLKIALLLLLVLIITSLFIFQPLPDNLDNFPTQQVKIPRGASFGQIADSLAMKGIINNKKQFVLVGRLSGKDKKIHSGMFLVPQGLNTWQVISFLEKAKRVSIKVTLPEGISAASMAGILQKALEIDSVRFMSYVNDSLLAESLGVETPTLDGYLLPETYYFVWKMPEKELVVFLANRTLEIFRPDSVQQRLRELNMSMNQIMTLASIIEGEVVIDSERTIVSSVYHNRLKSKWLLQADPTIQYLLKGSPRRLTYKDLRIDSPYNTYLYTGLPPTPINNPGKKSILAALYPARTSYFYFVAVGDGSHHFSKTSREHLYWKRKFDRIRKQVRLEEKRRQNQQRKGQ
ncbi:MAG: endolytic transglycosylase MltG [Calditrichia bacterium]